VHAARCPGDDKSLWVRNLIRTCVLSLQCHQMHILFEQN
jgi:hypothetical protein